jgi:hypothetical protein
MYSYVAYGLGIKSVFPLEELLPGEAGADIVISLVTDKQLSKQHFPAPKEHWVTETEAAFTWEEVGSLLIREGSQILVDPCQGGDSGLLSTLLCGWALALALHQRKLLVLHSSAVVVGKKAILIAAGAGKGKSSIAGALISRGHSLLADDVAAIKFDNGLLMVMPAFPSLKLSVESASALGYSPADRRPIFRGSDKSLFRLTDRFQREPVPLGRIYSLVDGDTVEIVALKSSDAVMTLVRNSYHIGMESPTNRTHNLSQCGSLAIKIPVLRLGRPRSFSALSEVALAIEEDVCNAG